MQRRMVTVGIVACVVALVVGGLCIAQPQGGGQGGQRGQGGGRGNFDPAAMQQRRMDMMKQQLGADDAAWKILEPRVSKVMDLNSQLQGRMGGRGMGMFGGRNRGGNAGGPGGNRPQRDPSTMTAIEKLQDQLSTLLENESASPEEITKQLTALRAAREKARQELATAQEELRKVLTPRQEALLVLMGQLQ
jgi:Spy/CpxP family protein refolding chaperone